MSVCLHGGKQCAGFGVVHGQVEQHSVEDFERESESLEEWITKTLVKLFMIHWTLKHASVCTACGGLKNRKERSDFTNFWITNLCWHCGLLQSLEVLFSFAHRDTCYGEHRYEVQKYDVYVKGWVCNWWNVWHCAGLGYPPAQFSYSWVKWKVRFDLKFLSFLAWELSHRGLFDPTISWICGYVVLGI